MSKKSVLFVCLGNICRSPLAQGVFEGIVEASGATDRYLVDSCGTGAWHAGEPPDPRSQDVALRNGIDISHQQARKIVPSDFANFDLIAVMDRSNQHDVERIASSDHAKISLLGDFSIENRGCEVPDPYYGGERGFQQVYELLVGACTGLFDHLEKG